MIDRKQKLLVCQYYSTTAQSKPMFIYRDETKQGNEIKLTLSTDDYLVSSPLDANFVYQTTYRAALQIYQ